MPCWVDEEELEDGVNGHGVGAGRKGCVRKEARSCSVCCVGIECPVVSFVLLEVPERLPVDVVCRTVVVVPSLESWLPRDEDEEVLQESVLPMVEEDDVLPIDEVEDAPLPREEDDGAR